MTLSKEMQEALDDFSVHDFAKMIIREGADRDIVDVMHDLEFAQYLFKNHLNDTLKGLETILDGRVIAK